MDICLQLNFVLSIFNFFMGNEALPEIHTGQYKIKDRHNILPESWVPFSLHFYGTIFASDTTLVRDIMGFDSVQHDTPQHLCGTIISLGYTSSCFP